MHKIISKRPMTCYTVPCFCCGAIGPNMARMCIQGEDGEGQVFACTCEACADKPARQIVEEMKGGKGV